jgi:cytochrome c oxidase subunit II
MALTRINIAKRGLAALGGTAVAALAGTGVALAEFGKAEPWQMWLQKTVTPVGDFISTFHVWLLWTTVIITLFVLALLVLVVMKFSAKKNPVPSQTTHHVGLEVAWTLIPVLILVVISVPSLRLLKMDVVPPPADMTLKVTGHAWYWRYEYPKTAGGFEFESRMLLEEDVADLVKKGKGKKEDYPRLLAVDNEVVVPVNKVVVLQVTAADVIHAFAMPAFGMKIDAMPGRLNQAWFKATREGVYYGQCSELCGKDHAYMPIAIRVVSDAAYATWLAEAKKKFAATDEAPARLASSLSEAPARLAATESAR